MFVSGTTPVSTSATHTYKIVHKANVPNIATGKSWQRTIEVVDIHNTDNNEDDYVEED